MKPQNIEILGSICGIALTIMMGLIGWFFWTLLHLLPIPLDRDIYLVIYVSWVVGALGMIIGWHIPEWAKKIDERLKD